MIKLGHHKTYDWQIFCINPQKLNYLKMVAFNDSLSLLDSKENILVTHNPQIFKKVLGEDVLKR